MAKYRVAPHDLEAWKIQVRVWGIWQDLIRSSTMEKATFDTEDEAKAYILHIIAAKDLQKVKKALIKERAKQIKPQEFPPESYFRK